MRRAMLLLAVVCLAFAPAPLPKPDRRSDAQKLEGEWERVRLYNGGSVFPEKPGEVTLTISGTVAAFSLRGMEQTKWDVKLAPLKSPKGLDLVGQGDSNGTIQHGIYRLEGGTLTYCYHGSARPTSFDPAAPGVFIQVLKRKKH